MEYIKWINTKGLPHEKWLEYRKAGIGGSDAPSILGLNAYRSAIQVWLDKKGLLPEKEENETLRFGRDIEQYIADRFEEYMAMQGTPKTTVKCNYILRNKKFPFMLADVDRLIKGEQAGLECKFTLNREGHDYETGMPPRFYVQAYHYMAVTGYKEWYVAVYVAQKGLNVFKIERDENEIRALTDVEREFWEFNIEQNQEPRPDGSERADEALSQLYPIADENREQIDLTPYAEELQNYEEIRTQYKALGREKERYEQIFKSILKDGTEGRYGDYTVTWKNVKGTEAFNAAKFREEHPDLYGQYLEPGKDSRRFGFKITK